MRPSFQFIILAALCACTTGLSAQNNPYCCAGYGGLFADSLGISIPEIKQVANIYNTYGNASVRVQLRRPVLQAPAACPLQKRPCVIVVHGGYWAEAGADDAWNTVSNEVSRHLVPAGFITAGVRYRTGVGGGNEVALLLSQPCLMNPVSDVQQAAGKAVADVQMATQYLFDNANALGIDTAQVYYMGYSAGAFNVIQAAYMRKGEQLYGTTLPGCPHVKGVIAFAGGVDQVARLEQTDRKIPLLLLHGAADNTVLPGCGNLSKCSAVSTFQWLVCGSRAVYDRCLQVGIPAELHLACGSDHGLNGLSPAFAPCYVKKWLSERIAGQPAKSAVFYDAAASTSAGGQICAAPVCQAPKVTCPPPVTIGQSTHFSLLEAGNAAPVGMTSAIRATADGKGSLVVGTRSNVNTTRAVVIRTDEQHTPLWTVELGYTAYNNPAQATYGADIVDLGNDQYVLLAALNTAFVNVEAFQNLDYVLVRFSRTTTGTVVHWTKRIGGPFNDVPHQLLRTKDGGLLASGYSNMEQALNLPGKMRTFLVKTDLSGNVLWSKRYQDGSACNTGLYSVAGGFNRRAVLETADGGLVFATPCDERIYLTKTNGSGQVLWNRSFNASGGLANGINLGGLGSVGLGAGSIGTVLSLREMPNGDLTLLGNSVLILIGTLYAPPSNLQVASATFPVGWLCTTSTQGIFKSGTAFFRQKSHNDPNQPVEMACQDFTVLPNGRLLVAAGLKGTLPALLEVDPVQQKFIGGTVLADALAAHAVTVTDNRGLSGLRLLYRPQTTQADLSSNLRKILRYKGTDWSKSTTCTTPLDRISSFAFKVEINSAPLLSSETLPQAILTVKFYSLQTAKTTNCGTALLAQTDAVLSEASFGSETNSPITNSPLRLAPNPAHGSSVVHLLTDTPDWVGALYEVLDAQGRLHAQGHLRDGQQALDLRGMATGLYMVRLTHPDGHTAVVKGVWSSIR